LRHISWDEVERGVKDIAQKVREHKWLTIHAVTGVPRGGIVPAAMLAYELNIPYAPTIVDESDMLVMEDIVDTGTTLASLPWKPITAALYMRHSSRCEPVLVHEVVQDESWLVFPWAPNDKHGQRPPYMKLNLHANTHCTMSNTSPPSSVLYTHIKPGDIFDVWDPIGEHMGRYVALALPKEDEDVPGHWTITVLKGVRHTDGRWHYTE